MTKTRRKVPPSTIEEIPVADLEAIVGSPFETWGGHCHEVSIAIVKAQVFKGSRVARGWAKGVVGQHSWIVVGPDCYASNAEIVDPTIWAYSKTVKTVWYGRAEQGWHFPHGAGVIWDGGRPENASPGEEVWLDKSDLSEPAKTFLSYVEPLDYHGWCVLASLPVGGWPAAEIHLALQRDTRLRGCSPIDVLGMLTDINPSALYLPGAEKPQKARQH